MVIQLCASWRHQNMSNKCCMCGFAFPKGRAEGLRLAAKVHPRPHPHYRAGHKQNIHLSSGAWRLSRILEFRWSFKCPRFMLWSTISLLFHAKWNKPIQSPQSLLWTLYVNRDILCNFILCLWSFVLECNFPSLFSLFKLLYKCFCVQLKLSVAS